MTRLILPVILFTFLMCSCSIFEKETPDPYEGNLFLKGKGAFIINEGNFMAGNGSISFFSDDSSKIYNDVFSNANGRPLGDIPYSACLNSDLLYIVINNSGKIEVVDIHDMKSVATIKDISSPRNMLIINSDKAYVTSLFSKVITIIDLKTNSVSGKINIRRSSEAIIMTGNKAYVSCWSSGKEVVVINTLTDKMIDSVEVGAEPESMVIDKEKKLWVLCTGGYTGQYFPELVMMNTANDEIEKRMTFPVKNLYPSSLVINASGDTLYYIGGSIWRFGIKDSAFPANPFIKANGRLFYRIGVEPVTGRFFATNAVDYMQKGYLLRFNGKGGLIDSARTDIIPGSIFFKTN